jgi:hypothetical protein
VVAWLAGLGVFAWLAWRARDPRHRRDPVSRLEAHQAARERFERERLRRSREARGDGRRGDDLRDYERELDERATARVQQLLERRRSRDDGDGGLAT